MFDAFSIWLLGRRCLRTVTKLLACHPSHGLRARRIRRGYHCLDALLTDRRFAIMKIRPYELLAPRNIELRRLHGWKFIVGRDGPAQLEELCGVRCHEGDLRLEFTNTTTQSAAHFSIRISCQWLTIARQRGQLLLQRGDARTQDVDSFVLTNNCRPQTIAAVHTGQAERKTGIGFVSCLSFHLRLCWKHHIQLHLHGYEARLECRDQRMTMSMAFVHHLVQLVHRQMHVLLKALDDVELSLALRQALLRDLDTTWQVFARRLEFREFGTKILWPGALLPQLFHS
mmetsp:Transcript_42983/g.113251  ORF Transcript_42983/g.113251 Transcript_42983/m.113251 type:complete len:285 (-) Transcript_42983:521-1375(-)